MTRDRSSLGRDVFVGVTSSLIVSAITAVFTRMSSLWPNVVTRSGGNGWLAWANLGSWLLTVVWTAQIPYYILRELRDGARDMDFVDWVVTVVLFGPAAWSVYAGVVMLTSATAPLPWPSDWWLLTPQRAGTR